MNSLTNVLATVVLCLYMSSPAVAQQSSVTAGVNGSATGKADVDVVTGNSGTSGFRVFNSASVGLFSITGTSDLIAGGGTELDRVAFPEGEEGRNVFARPIVIKETTMKRGISSRTAVARRMTLHG